jgi:hypothetical protein
VLASLLPLCFQLGHHSVYVLLGKTRKKDYDSASGPVDFR